MKLKVIVWIIKYKISRRFILLTNTFTFLPFVLNYMSRGTQTINLALHYTIVQFVIEIYRRGFAKSVDYSEFKLFQ